MKIPFSQIKEEESEELPLDQFEESKHHSSSGNNNLVNYGSFNMDQLS